MKRVGSNEAGFSAGFDSPTKTIYVKAWGFWDVDVAVAFGKTVKDTCINSPNGSKLIMDMNDLKPMRDEGQSSFIELMGVLPGIGVVGTTIMAKNQLTKLQLLRLIVEAGAKDKVRFT